MSIIRILPESLSNKIAAGEVVERPASVVKELVENALDAESTTIIIDIEKGGKTLIQVADNGIGMSNDDALLAVERYATSKIKTDQDLFAIRSLGFRGEALPSIASVSDFSLVTRQHDATGGTEIMISGGKINRVTEIGAPPGTMVTVRRLFFNTPARRKFLKTINTEMAHIADVVASYALGRPDVQFVLRHNAKTVKNWPPTDNQQERVADVLGREHLEQLLPIQFDTDELSLQGWVSSPLLARSTSRGIYTFVNGRYVRDKMLQHALFAGFAGRLMKGRYPVAVVFIAVPFDQVDVNVHPTKSEVRFAQHRMVHDRLVASVANALGDIDRPEWRPVTKSLGIGEQTGSIGEDNWGYANNANRALRSRSAPRENGDFGPRVDERRSSRPERSLLQQGFGTKGASTQPDQTSIWSYDRFGSLRVVGQIHNTYILCESSDGLICIDQHAAHERIYYEQLKKRSAPENASQRLLMPETMELNFREVETLKEMLPEISAMGFEIEPFGGNAFVIKAVPALLAGQAAGHIVREIVEKIADIGVAGDMTEAIDESLKMLACHSAIRARQKLSEKEMGELLQQLDTCENPSHCPHGRPTWIRWTNTDLQKAFKRIV